MVDDHAASGSQQGGQDVRQASRLDMDFDVPAQRIHASQQGLPARGGKLGHGQADQIQADAHHAGVGQGLQFAVGDAGGDDRHATQASRGGAQGVQQVAVVGA
ncbi:hypothetical protein G6F60_015598 [Rhizopus arrhizus]|nr:hypothetical protein G6F60_015598 [Rhizopus arrhizus]